MGLNADLRADNAKAAAVAYAESGATAPMLMAVFGWSNLRTAQIYIEKADKRRLISSAYDRRTNYQKPNGVSLLAVESVDETKPEKAMRKQCDFWGMVGDDGLEPPTSSV